MRWLLGMLVGLLALVGIGASIGHYLREPYNPGFLRYPAVTAVHVVLGGLYLTFAPFQFIKRIRSSWLNYHRWAGRALVAIGLVVGGTVLFMGLVIPVAGWSERVYISVFGSLYLVALINGFVNIRARRVSQHREWMIRAFAIGLSIATMRLIFIPAVILAGDPSDQQIATLSAVSFTAAFILHTTLAEAWIRGTRKHNLRLSMRA